ncbi:Proteasome activator BLM10 [Batrachochytrium dendrobatidis]
MRFWNAYLPYYGSEEQIYTTELLENIKQTLALSINAQDITVGATRAARALEEYIILKYPLKLSDRVWFSKIMFQLVTLPGLDLDLVLTFSNITCKLIKNKTKLPSDAMVLDGDSLECLLSKFFFPKQKDQMYPVASKIIGSVIKLAGYAQRFFSPEFATKLLELYFPRINIHYFPSMITRLSVVMLLLPVNVVPIAPKDMTVHASLSETPKFFWIPTFFSIWQMVVNVPTYDMLFIDLFGRLAEEQLATPEYCAWTDDQIRVIFTIGMKNFGLPIGSGSSGMERMPIRKHDSGLPIQPNGSDKNIQLMEGMSKSKVEYLAKFIVYTIFPPQVDSKQYSTKTLEHLEMLIQAIESFFHPSNTGKWSFPISHFIKTLSQEFVSRCKNEEDPETKVSPHYRITADIKQRFVMLLKTVAYLGMFGKDSRAVAYSNSTLKYLSWIDPEAVFPSLLERVYPSLEALNETHRTISCISALNTTALSLIHSSHYPDGGHHLTSLLHLTLPGLDINDISKSNSTLMFISNAIMTVPIFDVSASSYSMPTGMEKEIVSIYESHEKRRLSTAEFESWVSKYLDRIFAIFENLPQQYGAGQGSEMTAETTLLDMLMYTSEMIFSQLSDQLENMVLRKLVDFCGSNVISSATKAIGTLCCIVARANPRKRLALFVPLCCNSIREEIHHGAGSKLCSKLSANSNPFNFASMSDAALHWHQSILLSVVLNSGEALLEYQSEISSILDECVTKCVSRRGYKWAGKLLRNILFSLTRVYPREARSHAKKQWESTEFQESSHMHWGEMCTLETVDIQWHVPTTKEIQFARVLLERYMTLATSQLELYITSLTSSASQANPSGGGVDIGKWLSLLKNCLYGSAILLQPQPSMSLNDEMDDLDHYMMRFRRIPPNIGACFSDPNSAEYKDCLSQKETSYDILHRLARIMHIHCSNDVESIQSLLSCMDVCISFAGVNTASYDSSMRLYKYMKSSVCLTENQKAYPRCLIIQREKLIHMSRQKQLSMQRELTPKLRIMIEQDLPVFCVSGYIPVRIRAQKALTEALKCFPVTRFMVFPKVLKYLEPTAIENELSSSQMKGALYLFRSGAFQEMVLYHWKYTRLYLNTLVRAQHDDKPSVLELIRKAYILFLMQMSGVSYVTPSITDALMKLITGLHCDDVALLKTKALVKERFEKARVEYLELIESLVSFAQDNSSHWRFTAMAANLVDVLLKVDEPVSPTIMQFAVSNVINEHPIMRRNCVSLLTHILVILKHRATKQGTSYIAELKKQIPRSDFVHPFTLDSNTDSLENTQFNDQLDCGWLAQSHTLTVYKGVREFTQDAVLSFHDATSTKAHDILFSGLEDPSFWTMIATYSSQEASNSLEPFSNSTANLVKRIAGLFEDVLLKHLSPIIESFVDKPENKSAQRAGAELLAGVLRGAKHWCTLKQNALWTWAIPLLSRAFTQATSESIQYWIECVKFVTLARDPRRLRPLISLILDNSLELSPTSFFSETKKLVLAGTIVSVFANHLRAVSDKLLDGYFKVIQSPYAQVRESLGALLNQLVQLQWHPNAANTTVLMEVHIQEWAKGGPNSTQMSTYHGGSLSSKSLDQSNWHGITVPIYLQGHASILIQKLVNERMPQWRLHPRDPSSSCSDYGNASKTLLAWLTDALMSFRVAGIYPYMPMMLPLLFEMQEFWDGDLQIGAAAVAKLYPHFHHHPKLLCEALTTLLDFLSDRNMMKSDSAAVDEIQMVEYGWHLKVRVMPVLQVLFFRHLHMIPPAFINQIVMDVSACLGDRQVEVRQMASVTLGGLVRCSPYPPLISMLTSTFEKQLEQTRPAKDKSKSQPADINAAARLVKRHAAVLGLAALVQAFPYHAPEWMPNILVVLSTCISDSAPIRTTVSKTFADFKRTHQDNWMQDKLVFTEEQLTVLSDLLISPSYYA